MHERSSHQSGLQKRSAGVFAAGGFISHPQSLILPRFRNLPSRSEVALPVGAISNAHSGEIRPDASAQASRAGKT